MGGCLSNRQQDKSPIVKEEVQKQPVYLSNQQQLLQDDIRNKGQSMKKDAHTQEKQQQNKLKQPAQIVNRTPLDHLQQQKPKKKTTSIYQRLLNRNGIAHSITVEVAMGKIRSEDDTLNFSYGFDNSTRLNYALSNMNSNNKHTVTNTYSHHANRNHCHRLHRF